MAADISPEGKNKEKILLRWTAPTRSFKRHSRDVYVTIISVGVLFSLILFLIDGILPVFLVVALFFLFYVLSNVEPEKAEFKITSYGVRIADALTEWELIHGFWFIKRYSKDILVLETSRFVSRMELVIDKDMKEKMKKELEEYVDFIEQSPSLVDKTSSWVGNKLQ